MEEISIIINSFRADSIYRIHVPILSSTPYQATGAGYFHAFSDYSVERNNLNMYLLLLTLEGAGEITYRGRSFRLEPGYAVLINGLEYHKYRTAAGCPMWEFKWLRFSQKNMKEMDELFSRFDICPYPARSVVLQGLFDSFIASVAAPNDLDELKLSAFAASIFSELYEELRSTTVLTQATHSYVAETIQTIRKDFASPLSVDTLARSCFVTSFTYIRIFRRMTGFTPYQYLIRARLSESCALLENSADSIASIAEKTGFSSQNNFTKQFRKQYHMTPSQYRKQFGLIRLTSSASASPEIGDGRG